MANGLEKRQELLAKAKELGIEGASKLKNVDLEEKIAALAPGPNSESNGDPNPDDPAPLEDAPEVEQLPDKPPVDFVVDVPNHVNVVEDAEEERWPRTFGQQAVLYTDEASQILHNEDGERIHPLNRSYGVKDLRAKKGNRYEDKDDE